MKKFLIIILSLLLLVGCSNKEIDNTFNNEVTMSSKENELIPSRKFATSYLSDIEFRLDFDVFESYFGESSFLVGEDCDDGYMYDLKLDIKPGDKNEAGNHFNAMIKYVSDIAGYDVKEEVITKINSAVEECKSSNELKEYGNVWRDIVLIENDTFTLVQSINLQTSNLNDDLIEYYILQLSI